MAEKEFIVTHAHARAPITVRGKNLIEALEKAGLNLNIWKEVVPAGQQDSPPDTEPESAPGPD